MIISEEEKNRIREGEEESAGLEPGMSGFDDGMTTNQDIKKKL